MIDYATFISTVGQRAGVASTEESRRAVEGVLAAIATTTEQSDRRDLADVLPGKLRGALQSQDGAKPGDTTDFVAGVAQNLDSTPERARYYAEAVLGVLAETEPDIVQRITQRLPGAQDLLVSSTDDTAMRDSAVPAGQTPGLLTKEELQQELAQMPAWEGDETRLRRTVGLPSERILPLLNAVHRAESELNHHARTEETSDGVMFEVSTHSMGRVTDMDVALARRIDHAVATIGSGG